MVAFPSLFRSETDQSLLGIKDRDGHQRGGNILDQRNFCKNVLVANNKSESEGLQSSLDKRTIDCPLYRSGKSMVPSRAPHPDAHTMS
jgi:hypothetical protein